MPVAQEMTLAELKKALRSMAYEQLEGMICLLYRQSKDSSRYMNARFNGTAYAPKLLDDFSREINRFIPMDFNHPMPLALARSR